MSHMPVDHPLRGFYRGLTGLTGVVSIAYGAIALAQTSDHSFFDAHGERVLGMQSNAAAGVFWVVVGGIALLTALVGRNLDARLNFVVGPVLWALGTLGLIMIRQPDNFFAFSVTSVCAIYVVGGILLTSSLYARVSGGAPARRPSSAATERESVGAGH